MGEEAVEVLGKATEEHKSSLLSIAREVQTFQEGEHTGAALKLQHAIELGQRYLSKGDALFLQRLLSGEVPQADWKKLNRKAEFKMKYKARSTKIQATLKKLLADFKSSKEEADKKEEAAQAQYETLKESKEGQLKTSQESLNK